jgi:hypothetical protein
VVLASSHYYSYMKKGHWLEARFDKLLLCHIMIVSFRDCQTFFYKCLGKMFAKLYQHWSYTWKMNTLFLNSLWHKKTTREKHWVLIFLEKKCYFWAIFHFFFFFFLGLDKIFRIENIFITFLQTYKHFQNNLFWIDHFNENKSYIKCFFLL